MHYFVYFLTLFFLTFPSIHAAQIEDLLIEEPESSDQWLGEYEILTWSPQSKNYLHNNTCLSQFLDQPSLSKVKSLSLIRRQSDIIMDFSTHNAASLRFTKLTKFCRDNQCTLSSDFQKGSFFARAVSLVQGMSYHFRTDLRPTTNKKWQFQVTHELKILGLFPINKFSQACLFRSISN